MDLRVTPTLLKKADKEEIQRLEVYQPHFHNVPAQASQEYRRKIFFLRTYKCNFLTVNISLQIACARLCAVCYLAYATQMLLEDRQKNRHRLFIQKVLRLSSALLLERFSFKSDFIWVTSFGVCLPPSS